MLTPNEQPTSTVRETLREVPIQLIETADGFDLSSDDPNVRRTAEYLDYLLVQADHGLLVRFVFPAVFAGYGVELQPAGDLPALALYEEMDLSISLQPLDAAKKPKLPSHVRIRSRPKGGG